MPSSATSSLRLQKVGIGEQLNTWGSSLNTDYDLIDTAIAGFTTVAITGNYTLSSANYAPDQARYGALRFTGALGSNATITIPAVSKSYWIQNDTNKALVFTTGSGATFTIDAGDVTSILCDATNVKTITYGGLTLKDYITSFAAGSGAVPSPIGNAGKYLFSTGAAVIWRQPSTADLSDYQSLVLGVQVALAVAL